MIQYKLSFGNFKTGLLDYCVTVHELNANILSNVVVWTIAEGNYVFNEQSFNNSNLINVVKSSWVSCISLEQDICS